ncbi:MAG TPA: hypothetical protein VFX51_26260 [Solirubrobacteraceae bacterium]|nr:hypothetical protein [Solirubrobacteraceae bacterium]
MNWNWAKLPPVMERTLADDLKAALFVFSGVLLGYLVFAGHDTSILLGALIGLALMVVVLNVVRSVRRRRHP